MNRRSLLAEIQSELKQYDESGLLDYRSLNRWLKNEVKRFGANVMILTEKVVEVKNGKAILPEDFFSLNIAAKCDADSHEFNEGCREDLQSSQYWTQRLETTYEWDNLSGSHKGVDYKCIEEKIYHNNCAITFRYRNPQLLKLTKGIKRDICSNSCKNIKVRQAPWEMNILGETLNFNFKEGYVYLQYYGIPTDEEGDLYIPDVRSLEEYLIAYCKRKTLETLWLNDDDVNLVNKLSYMKQEERELFGLAMTQTKFEALSKNWDEKIKRKNRIDMNKYERMFPSN